jgi:nucleotide-binding universal stress UspA family protein
MRRVVLALQDRSEAVRLTTVASTLAEPGAEVDVTHVLEVASGQDFADAQAMVGESVELLQARGLLASGHVEAPASCGVADQLAERARASGAEMVVMGSRGLGHIGGLFGRSVSHALLTRLSLPVLMVPPTARLPLYGCRRVLVALRDEDDVRAAAASIRLLRPPFEVLAVHVPRRVAVHAGREGQPAFVEIQETSTLVLAAAREQFKEAGIAASTRSLPRAGGVAAAITKIAGSWDADLVVLVSRRLREWEAVIAGSTSHEVLHLCDRPVLVAGWAAAAP